MRNFKKEQIIFYCNCLGELHRGGKEKLRCVTDLPLPLQSVYETFWTDGLTSPCYIAYVDDRPGLLIAAEYNDEICKTRNFPQNSDGKYAALCDHCNKLEPLVRSVSDTAELGIGIDTGFDQELILFIPTQFASAWEILQLFFLMDEFAFADPPDTVLWDTYKCRLLELLNHCIVPSNIRIQLVVQLAALGGSQADEMIRYMGLHIPRYDLPSMCDVIKHLELHGAFDSTLDCYCNAFLDQFGQDLIWKYPFSHDMRYGAAIIPVREGFLYLPYVEVMASLGARYDLRAVELLTEGAANMLLEKASSYVDGLCAALRDMIRCLDMTVSDCADGVEQN